MKYYYDFHLHTALSPCADDSMTPNNIVNLAKMLGLDCIAITDHNSYQNIEPVMQVAEDLDLIVIPGMEVETSEEIHVVCLFKELDTVKKFGDIIFSRLNKIENNERIFGKQQILDRNDEVLGKVDNLLITSINIDIYELIELVRKFDGIAIPAHIDRNSYSIVSNLGFIPEDLNINLVEFSREAMPKEFLDSLKKYSKKDYKYIISSDSHYLENMCVAKYFLEFESHPTASDIIEKLKNIK